MRSSFHDLKQKIQQIEAIFDDANIPLRKDSDLGRIIADAKSCSESAQMKIPEKVSSEMFFNAMHLDRIAKALLPLANVKDKCKYLKAVLSGTLDFFKRKQSHAKDIFWELEVWSKLLTSSQHVFLKEPDIAIEFEDVHIGIACKKIYSEGHIQQVLSKAVHQIGNNYQFGIAAFNIDDLLQGEATLKHTSLDGVIEWLHNRNGEFLEKHDRHFRKYLANGRILVALISSSIISDVPSEQPRFQNLQPWTIWEIPGLPKEHLKQRDRLYELIMN